MIGLSSVRDGLCPTLFCSAPCAQCKLISSLTVLAVVSIVFPFKRMLIDAFQPNKSVVL